MKSRLRFILEALFDFQLLLVTHWPGATGYRIRYAFWKKRLRFLGENVLLDTGIHFQSPAFIEIEGNCWIDRNVVIMAGPDQSAREKIIKRNKQFPGIPGVVHIGRNVHVGPGCVLSGISSGIFISDDCGLSANTKLYAFSHHYRSKTSPSDTNISFGPLVSQERQCLMEGAIYLGNNTGIALNCVILPGTSIAENCFVAINSVVSGGSFEQNCVIAGNPAKRVSDRFAAPTST
jgi:acetyltransferase-like isoleucine patch superfamily enzyme